MLEHAPTTGKAGPSVNSDIINVLLCTNLIRIVDLAIYDPCKTGLEALPRHAATLRWTYCVVPAKRIRALLLGFYLCLESSPSMTHWHRLQNELLYSLMLMQREEAGVPFLDDRVVFGSF